MDIIKNKAAATAALEILKNSVGTFVQTVFGTEGEIMNVISDAPYSNAVHVYVKAFKGGSWTPGVLYTVPAETLKVCEAAYAK